MAESIEDLNLPKSIVSSIIKDGLPPGASATKEVKSAIARAASVFILFITSSSNNNLKTQKRKVILPSDIMESLSAISFDDYIPPLKEVLKEYKKNLSNGKMKKKTKDETQDSKNGHSIDDTSNTENTTANNCNDDHIENENVIRNGIDAANENGAYNTKYDTLSDVEVETADHTLESDDDSYDIEIDNAGLATESDMESIKSDFETVEETGYSIDTHDSCEEGKLKENTSSTNEKLDSGDVTGDEKFESKNLLEDNHE